MRSVLIALVVTLACLVGCGGNSNSGGAGPTRGSVPTAPTAGTNTGNGTGVIVSGTPGVPVVGTANVPVTPGVLLTSATNGTGGTGTGTTASAAGRNPASGSGAAAGISGTALDAATGQPIQGTIAVALEQPTANGYTIVQEISTDSSGNFNFSSVTPGVTYAVVIAAASGTNFYIPAIVAGGGLGVPSGATFGGANAITAGTNIGTVSLTLPNSGPTSTDVNVANVPANGFGAVNENVGGTTFAIPLVNQSSNLVTVPFFTAQLAGFNPAGMTFTPAAPVVISTTP